MRFDPMLWGIVAACLLGLYLVGRLVGELWRINQTLTAMASKPSAVDTIRPIVHEAEKIGTLLTLQTRALERIAGMSERRILPDRDPERVLRG